jgi:hypothetical protein
MSFSTPIQWFHSHEDPVWPDSTFKEVPSSAIHPHVFWTGKNKKISTLIVFTFRVEEYTIHTRADTKVQS